jgi:hypothetical protein
MRSRAHALALAALVGSVPAAAWADGAAPAGSAATSTSTATVTVTPMADQSAAGGASAAPASSDAPSDAAPATSGAPKASGSQATGMTWSTPKQHGKDAPTASPHRTHATAAAAPTGPGTVVPGFEMLGDGSTRVFLQMPKAATYSAKAGPSGVTYVLKDVHVDKRNNYNPLVTVHFNTPVTSARLVPHGKDLWLVIALRAKVQPTAAMQPAKDGGSVLQLDFPKGDYLPPPGTAAASAPPNP